MYLYYTVSYTDIHGFEDEILGVPNVDESSVIIVDDDGSVAEMPVKSEQPYESLSDVERAKKVRSYSNIIYDFDILCISQDFHLLHDLVGRNINFNDLKILVHLAIRKIDSIFTF